MSARYRTAPDRNAMGHHAVPSTPLSARLRALCGPIGGAVALGELADAAGKGAAALLLFLFAIASFVPGVAPVFGAAISLLSLSLLRRAEAMSLPDALRRRTIPRERLAGLLRRWLPRLEWVEARLKSRLRWVTRGPAMCAVALACFVSGVLIILPIPFGNVPPAASVLCLSLGIAAADGLLILGGAGIFLLALGFDVAVIVVFSDAIAAVVAAFI